MDAKKLHDELIAAGIIDVVTVVSDGRVIDNGNNEIQPRPDVAAVIAAHDPTETPAPSSVIFDLPLIAPSITVSEIIVQSPKPKDKADDALTHLVSLAKSKDKPLAEIILNLVVYVADLEQRVKKKNI